jgi:predicted nucleic acid-binding protein
MSRFFDSNILLYLIDQDDRKSPIAEELVFGGGTISVQVLNEFVEVARRKLKLSVATAGELLDHTTKDLNIVPLTHETQRVAMRFMASADIGTYDANIIAAAELAGCDVLYTEDMNHGQRIGRVTIRNPFVAG